MTTIETTVDIGPNRHLAIQLPDVVAPGRHRIVLQIEDGQGLPNQSDIATLLPKWDAGPWPENLSLRREDMYGDDGR